MKRPEEENAPSGSGRSAAPRGRGRRAHPRGAAALVLGLAAALGAAPASAEPPPWSAPLPAESRLVLAHGARSLEVGSRFAWLEDPEGRLAPSAALAAPFNPSSGSPPNFGWSAHAYWFSLELEDRRPDRSEDLFLELGWPLFDEIELWDFDAEGGLLRHYAGGDSRVGAWKDIRVPHFVFALPSAPSHRLLVRAKSEDTIQLPATIRTAGALVEASRRGSLAWGMLFGFIGLMLLYSLLVGIFLKDGTYLFYAAYLASMVLFELTYSGFGYTYLWGGIGGLQNRLLPFSMALFYLASFRFTGRFLGLRSGSRGIGIHFALFEATCALSLLASFLLSPRLMGAFLNLAVFYGIPLILLASVQRIRQGHRPAWHFLFAWISYIGGGLLLVFKDFRLLPVGPVTDYGIHAGFITQILLFLYAIAAQVQGIKQERERYLRDYLEEQEKRIGHYRELLEEKSKAERYYEQSLRDPLTGLYNRAALPLAVERLGARAGVIAIDLDDFKEVNDGLGHAAGDRVLVSTARLLEERVRKEDWIVRIGGDEFLIALPDCPPRRLDEIVAALRRHFAPRKDCGPAGYGASVGWASREGAEAVDEAAFREMVAEADVRMYEEKSRRKRRG